jgi:hypothetical protein
MLPEDLIWSVRSSEIYMNSNFLGSLELQYSIVISYNLSTQTTTSTLEILADTWVGSTLTSSGNVIMNVIENTLGFDLVPDYPGIGIDGVYLFFSDSPTEDIFNPKKSTFTVGTTVPYGFSSNLPLFMASIDPLFFTPFLYVIDVQTFSSANYMLYNTPIEVKIYN